jgi:hypothetical protein
MVMQTIRNMPLSELRIRVEEAEKLLGVAKQLARDELSDPQHSTRARDRIGSIVNEVQGMFPGLGEPESMEMTLEEVAGDLDDSGPLPADADADSDSDADEEEWEIDCEKLRAALDDEALMAQVPESERSRFRAMAERLLEVHERGELYARILTGFEELAEVTRVGAEAVQRQLAAMLTFGGTASLSELGQFDMEAMLTAVPKYKA